jgi:integrase
MPSDMQYRDRFFSTICKQAGVRYRPPNNARHTYTSQLLTKGVPKEWLATQLGHTTTKMIEDHYGKWMSEETPNMAAMVSQMLGFSVPVRPLQDQVFCNELTIRYKSSA